LLTIRPAGFADVTVLAQLGAETYRSHFAGIWSPAALEAYIEGEYGAAALQQSLGELDVSTWLLAETPGGKAIGFAKLNWNRPLPVDWNGVRPVGTELQKIYFAAEEGGSGYGAQMMAAIATLATERAPLLWLDVLKSNDGAPRFYERNGFTLIGEFPFATDLREIGMSVMARWLR